MLVTSGLAHLPPIKVVTILAGVISFPLGWFIVSAIVARGARFLFLAWLLRRYGEPIRHFVEERLGTACRGRGRRPYFALLARQIPASDGPIRTGGTLPHDHLSPPRPRHVQRNTALFLTVAMAAVGRRSALGFEHIGGYIPCKLCLRAAHPLLYRRAADGAGGDVRHAALAAGRHARCCCWPARC